MHLVLADFGVCSHFVSLTPHGVSMSLQALAASWAAFCSHDIQQTDMEAKFLKLTLFFMTQYGLSHIIAAAWQRQFPSALPGLTPYHSRYSRLIDMQAPSQHPKPGGWSCEEWGLCGHKLLPSTSRQQGALSHRYLYIGIQFMNWCENKVEPVLATYAL